MVSSNTLHVISTEVAIGAYATAGVAFLLAGVASHGWLRSGRHLRMADMTAHFALAFGLLAMPFAMVTGIQSSPGESVDHPLLLNKMLLGSAAIGLALGVLLTRRRLGAHVWSDRWGRRWQSLGGLLAVGMVLITASMGGTYSRGESLLDGLSLPYDQVPLMPLWLSVVVMVLAVLNLVTVRRSSA
ncbi:MAG: hypothetical protein CMA08_01255 [Euryarchaeota archaeon]|nr:hypothetical protein [Euryarchaeota archaeon]OUX22899.1 MAG: hypothetical protein CBE12_01165 [Euryarchaeota archaeon TMED252]